MRGAKLLCLRRDLVRAAGAFVLALPVTAAERTFDMALVGGRVAEPQRMVRVLKDDAVVIRLGSDAPGELHLHGYRLAAALGPGKPTEWRFRAHATGRYRFEWHAAGDKGSHHHGPALATLEVLPR